MKTIKELEIIEQYGKTCIDCMHYPCSNKQENIKPLCFCYEEKREIECKYFECPYSNPVCHIYCK